MIEIIAFQRDQFEAFAFVPADGVAGGRSGGVGSRGRKSDGMGGCNAQFKSCAPVDPSASGGPPFSLLDGVSLTGSAPEPSTWAMMVVGFGGLAYAGLRNRRRSAVSAAA